MPSLSQIHRPRRFADVTGQQHITETLRKEVATGQLGHAYLFSGPRGVGKTTAARIFAKALNCVQPEEGEPCNVCANCTAANEGRLLDLIELDAATHTGVETVREAIIEHARFAPTQGKRKVYVLDEAHMLSTSSWNALLKTLEEPPTYAFFILATTEWHKVPATIISRCQRFEFLRIPPALLADRVREVAAKEGWTIDPEVVSLIVSRADGCVRDAETLLGQLGSLAGDRVTMEVARLVIPERHVAHAAGVLATWADHDHARALAEAARLMEMGIPAIPLFDDLIFLLQRTLATSGMTAESIMEDGSEESRAVAGLQGRFTPGEIVDLSLLLMERRKDVKSGVDPLFALQLAGTAVTCGLLRHAPTTSHRAEPEPPRPTPTPTPTPMRTPPPKPVETVSPPAEKGVASAEIQIPQAGPVEATPTAMDAAPEASASGTSFTLPEVRTKWAAFIRNVDEKNHSLPFILKISQPYAVQGTTLTIRFQYAFHRDKVLVDMKHRRIVEDALKETLGVSVLQLEGIVGEDTQTQTAAPAADMVTNVLKAFGGSVVE